jgi:hypothetical protein
MDSKAEIAAIRKALKAKIPTLSVKNDRGTAWGWIKIRGSGEWGSFTDAERTGLKALGLNPGGNVALISPDSRSFWLKKLCGVGHAKPCIVCGEEAASAFLCNCDLSHWTCATHQGMVTDCANVGRMKEG